MTVINATSRPGTEAGCSSKSLLEVIPIHLQQLHKKRLCGNAGAGVNLNRVHDNEGSGWEGCRVCRGGLQLFRVRLATLFFLKSY